MASAPKLIQRKVDEIDKKSFYTKSQFLLSQQNSRKTLYNCSLSLNSNKRQNWFKCTHCSFGTNSVIILLKHVAVCQAIEDDWIKSAPEQLIDSLKRAQQGNTGSKLYQCEYCGIFYTVFTTLKRHILSEHLPNGKIEWLKCQGIKWFTCDQCDYKTQNKKYFKNHLNKHDISCWLQCEYCGVLCFNSGMLKQHISNKHTPDQQIKWFKCEQCNYKSRYKGALKTHSSKMHLKKTNWFKCAECDFVTSSKMVLDEHIEKEHKVSEKVDLHKCGICDFQSQDILEMNNHNLKNHQRFKCNQCSYQCGWSSSLSLHKKNMHTPLEQIKWKKCQQCDFKAKDPSTLRKHIKNRHTSEENIKWNYCEYCEFRTKTRSTIKKHLVHIHTADQQIKWFQCEQCTYKGKLKGHLTRHIATNHTAPENIKWFRCGQCDYKSKDNYQLKVHKRKHELKKFFTKTVSM